MLDKLAIEKERNELEQTNLQLRTVLKQYLDGQGSSCACLYLWSPMYLPTSTQTSTTCRFPPFTTSTGGGMGAGWSCILTVIHLLLSVQTPITWFPR